jgi:predicted DsbA family dithiol-disulfide isomerase
MWGMLTIRHFTDPACPWAFSAEPVRRVLQWRYGDQLDWQLRLVGLSERPEDYLEKGFTPERQAGGMEMIARDHHMPIDWRMRPRMTATIAPCRAVVAARLHDPEREDALLRRLRILHMSGELIDEPATIDRAAREAGVDPDALRRWMADPDVEERLRADMAEARRPGAAALHLDHKLAPWSGGRRYTCPSYEIVRPSDGCRTAVPGFQPAAVAEVVIANLDPQLERREDPETVEQVLAHFDEPLSTAEVAAVMGASIEETRSELARVAAFEPVGLDGWWTLPAAAEQRLAA